MYNQFIINLLLELSKAEWSGMNFDAVLADLDDLYTHVGWS